MSSGSNSLTTYYAKRIIGDTAAANASSALLQTGTGIDTNTWILNRTNRVSEYGIKYVYDSSTSTVEEEGQEPVTVNNGHDKIEFHGGGTNASAWVQLDTGDVYAAGNMGIGTDPSGSEHKLSVDGSALFVDHVYIENVNKTKAIIFQQHGSSARVGLIKYDNGDATNVTSGQFTFAEYSPKSTPDTSSTGYRENYTLPVCTAGLSANVNYDILTSKDLSFSITGNAATASVLNNDGGRRTSSEYMHADGKLRFYLATSSMSTGKPPTGDGFILKGGWDNTGGWDAMISWSNSGHMSVRGTSGSGNATNHTQAWKAWSTILDSDNYTSYTVTKTGTGASGSWGISVTGSSASCTGNAATATALGTDAGNANTPVYFTGGKPSACNNKLGAQSTNGYWGMGSADNAFNVWIRTTTQGIIPYQSGNKGGGHCSLGTSTWYFSTAYIDTVTSNKTYGAVWNDIAECRQTEDIDPGRVVVETGDKMILSSTRLQATARVVSDTYGYCMGEPADDGTPIAIAGRVLVYPYQDRNNYKLGDAVCAAPNGTVDIMTREEIKEYPDRIVGIVSEIPQYEKYEPRGGGGEHAVINGRIWIYVR